MIVGRTINYNRLRNPVAAHRTFDRATRLLIAQLYGNGELGGLYIAKAKFAYQDAAGTVPVSADGDPVGLVISQQGDTNASSATPTDQTYGIDGSYTYIDHTSGSLTATLPDLGTGAALCIVSLNGIEYQDGLTISGATTLPQQEWDAVLYRDAAFTPAEQEIIEGYFKGYGHRELSLDFAAQDYTIGDRPIENVHRLLVVERATPKWVYNASGRLVEVPANEPAYQHDPDTGEPQGILIEESRTNLLLWSREIDKWYINAGAKILGTIEDKGTTFFEVYSADTDNGSASITADLDANAVYTYSAIVKKGTANPTLISLQGAGVDSGHQIKIDWGSNGEITSVYGTGDPEHPPEYEHIGGGYYRVSRVITANSTGGPVTCYIWPASYVADGSSYGSVWISDVQLEKGEGATSPIPTTDAPVTRAADNVSRALGDEYDPNVGTYTIRAAVPTGETVATLGTVSVTSTSDEMTTYTLSYSSDPGATELVLGYGLFDSIYYAPGVGQ